MPGEFKRVKQVFLEAVDKSDRTERDAWLRSECREDESLRRQVEALLRRHDNVGNFLEPPDIKSSGTPDPEAETFPRNHSSTPNDAVGSHIGPYHLLVQLGEGGMGTVYLAEQEHPIKRRVALKVIKAGMDSAQVIARFEQERQALAVMDHPHIARVLDAGMTDAGRPYFVMELVEGVPVTTYCDQERLTPRERLELFIPVCQAVQHAHQKGVIHRDLKPSNVLIALYDAQPVPKVIDFGVAKATGRTLAERSLFTEAGVMVGTLEYMAPEQAELNNVDIDTRADIYSLGVLLYELLTGSLPFTAKQLRSAGFSEMLRMIKEVEPPKPSTKISSSDELPSIAAKRALEPARLRKLVKGELDWIVMKCLEKDRGRRYQTANGLGTDVQRYLADEPVVAGPPSTSYRLRKFLGRNKGTVITAASIACLVMAGAVTATLLAIWAVEERDRARLELGNSLVAQGAAVQHTGLIGQRFESLRLLGEAARELREHPQGRDRLPEIRNHAIAALALTDLRVRWERPVANVVGVQCDPQLERYAFVDLHGTGRTSVRGLADDDDLLSLPHPGVNFWHAATDFSADGQYLLACYWVRGQDKPLLHVWHLDRKELVFAQRCSAGQEAYLPAAVHPNGHWLVFCPPDNGLCIWDLVERREVRRLPLDWTPVTVCLDREGKRAAVDHFSASLVKIVDLETGQELASWSGPVGTVVLAWSADGQLLASTGGGRVYVWHVRRGELASVLLGHTNAVSCARFARAGHMLATASWDGTTRLWDAASAESLVTAPGVLCRFSADDARLAFVRGTKLGVWDTAHGHEYRTLHPGMIGNRTEKPETAAVWAAEFSPDGGLLATVADDGVRLLEVASGRERAYLRAGPGGRALFHPDGQSLITHSTWGLYRWPIRHGPGGVPELVQIGPPGLLYNIIPQPGRHVDARWMPDHRALAVLDNNNSRVLIVDVTQPQPAASQPTVLQSEHRRMMSVDVTPDGQWLATGGWKERGIQVWNVPERRLERVLRPEDVTGWPVFSAYFSPDGRWLVGAATSSYNTSLGYYFWRVGTWELEMHVPAELCYVIAAFSGDGKIMALPVTPQQILLADPADGRELARLSTLQPVNAFPAAFSPDGTQLAVVTGPRTVLVWDLRRMREQLATMGLDWEAADFGPFGK